jgi:hypothetical protein
MEMFLRMLWLLTFSKLTAKNKTKMNKISRIVTKINLGRLKAAATWKAVIKTIKSRFVSLISQSLLSRARTS